MKITIRTKLILSFVAVIVVPIVTTFGSMWLLFGKLDRQYDMGQLDHLQYVNAEVRDTIVAGYSVLIDNPSRFASLMEETIERYDINLEIYDEDGKLLFNTLDTNKLNSTHETDRQMANFTQNTMTIPIDANKNVKVIVHLSPNSVPSQIMVSFIKAIGLSIGIGFISLIIAIGTFTWFISRSILRPLQELNRGTEQVSHGDFDFDINYHKDNEFGNLVKAFMLMKEKLKESIEKQAEQERLRKQLVANISHDIRTPVASIKGYVEGIQDGIVKNQEQLNKYLAVIHDKTDQLDRLVDDLYQYSQLEVGKMDVILHEYCSKDLFSSLLRQFEVQFDDGEPRLTTKYDNLEGNIMADKQRIMQVMENLVGNANRYIDNKNGKIKITIEQYKGRFIKVSVEDNGRGITEDDLPFVFDQFYRGEKSRSRQYGGTGLGLSISKYIIEAHGGTIWITSKVGEGTTVHFTLPKEIIS